MRMTGQRGENEEGLEAGEGDTKGSPASASLGSPPAARKEAPCKEELVEGPSHLVREDFPSDPSLLPSLAPLTHLSG